MTNAHLETASIGYILPTSQCDMNWTIQERGVLSATGFLGMVISSYFWGVLSDTTGRKRVMRITLIFGFIFSVISSFATNFWMFFALRLLNGVCISGGGATIFAYLGEFHTSKTRDRAIMGASIVYGVGHIIMPFFALAIFNWEWSFYISGLNIVYKHWRLFIIVCTTPGFICGLLLYILPESPKYLLSIGRDEEALIVLRKIYHINSGKPKETFPVKQILSIKDTGNKSKKENYLKVMWNQTKPLFNRNYLRTTLLVCLMQFVVYAAGDGMYIWFPDIVNSVMENNSYQNESTICHIYDTKLANIFDGHSSDACIGKFEMSTYQYSLIVELIYLLGPVLYSFVIDRVGMICIIWTSLVLMGAAGVAAVAVHNPVLAIYFYIWPAAFGIVIQVFGGLVVSLYPTKLRGMAVNISQISGRLGCVVGVYLMGFILKDFCMESLYCCGVALIVTGFLAFFIPKNKLVDCE
ncbi:hypothetical protein ACFFRR_006787 [Megaselia abdita]